MSESATYPLVLSGLANLRCVVVGGGAVAERKIRGLIDGGARPVVISPALTEDVRQFAAAGQITHLARAYAPGDLDGAVLAFAATSDAATNAAIAAEAAERGVLVNLADNGPTSTFHTTATVRRGSLLISISSGIPALSASIRRELDTRYGEEYTTLTALLRDIRARLGASIPAAEKTRFWRALVGEQALGWLRAGEPHRLLSHARTLHDHISAPAEPPAD